MNHYIQYLSVTWDSRNQYRIGERFQRKLHGGGQLRQDPIYFGWRRTRSRLGMDNRPEDTDHRKKAELEKAHHCKEQREPEIDFCFYCK